MQKDNNNKMMEAINKAMKDIESRVKILRLFMSFASPIDSLADSRDIAAGIGFEGEEDEEDIIYRIHDTVGDYLELYKQVPEVTDFCHWQEDEEGNEYCLLNLYGFNLLMTDGISTGDKELDDKIHKAFRELTPLKLLKPFKACHSF